MSLLWAVTNGALLAAAGISTARRTWDRSATDLALRPHAVPGMPAAAFWSVSIVIGAAAWQPAWPNAATFDPTTPPQMAAIPQRCKGIERDE